LPGLTRPRQAVGSKAGTYWFSIIPFFFLDNPILLIGVDPTATAAGTAWATFTASLGTVSLVAGLEGWLLQKCTVFERLILWQQGLPCCIREF